MSSFVLNNGELYAESVPLTEIAARFGTPCYVYSRALLERAFREYQETLGNTPSLVCFAVKSNSNIGILNVFSRLGAGFDIVSGGELKRALAAGADPQKIVFSGVGKSHEEIAFALKTGILCFNVESHPELLRINEIAGELKKRAPISLRVNPNVDPKTHPYISTGLRENKFGVAYEDALPFYREAARLPHLEVVGIDCHIGSQLLDPSPFLEALEKILLLVDALEHEGIALRHIDLGGGLGIRYRDETEPTAEAYLRPLLQRLAGRGLKLILEPGRRLVGNAGLLLTRVEYLKPGAVKNFAIVDAAMNDLARPALYDAWHDIVPVKPSLRDEKPWQIVGPICESGDFLAKDRPLSLASGDLLAILSAGAYGMAMSSNYNTRPRAPEIMVDGDKMHLIRERESVESLFALERCLP